MKDSRALLLLALAAATSAQSAPGFPIDVTTNLRADFQDTSTSISPAGVLLQRDDILDEPVLVGPQDATSTLNFMAFLVDQDVQSPQDPNSRVQFLHWWQPNLAGASEVLSDDGSRVKNFTDAPALAYVPPTPPGGDIAHKYTLLMFSQPEGFSIPSNFESFFTDTSDLSNRLDFDIAGFVSATGLGSPVGATWFQVQNTTGSGSTTSSSSSTTTTTTGNTASSSTTFSTSTTTTSSDESSTTTTTADSTSTDTTSTSESSSTPTSTPEITASTSEEPLTSTVVVTPSASTPTDSSASSATESGSATPTFASGSGAWSVTHDRSRPLMMAVAFGLVGAGFWLL